MNNDWRNARIEEAAKAMADGEHNPLGWRGHSDDEKDWYRKDAAIALAVFEKALGEATVTPTDDERGALTNKATTPDGRLEHHLLEGEAVTMYPYWAADLRTVIAGFRRPVVPEPSAPAEARGRSRGNHTDAQMLYMICLALEEGLEGVANIDVPDLIVKMISEHWGTADEDTSPGEAEAALAQLAPYIPDHMRAPEPQGEPATETSAELEVQVDVPSDVAQGEPSDAQVRAAALAWIGSGEPDEPTLWNARAALRAASAVTEQGESR